jgi:hypothetical protein
MRPMIFLMGLTMTIDESLRGQCRSPTNDAASSVPPPSC